MRVFALVALGATACLAQADRLVTVPTGTKVYSGYFKLEGVDWGGDKTQQAWLAYGVNRSLEVAATWFRPDGEKGKVSFDASYNVVAPITDTSPGISLGFLDGANVTPEGRTLYLAATYRIGNDGELNQDVPTELHFGFWSRKEGLLFAGASLPFSPQVRLVAEYDSLRITAGVELRPLQPMSVKLLARDGRPSLGLAWSQKL